MQGGNSRNSAKALGLPEDLLGFRAGRQSSRPKARVRGWGYDRGTQILSLPPKGPIQCSNQLPTQPRVDATRHSAFKENSRFARLESDRCKRPTANRRSSMLFCTQWPPVESRTSFGTIARPLLRARITIAREEVWSTEFDLAPHASLSPLED